MTNCQALGQGTYKELTNGILLVTPRCYRHVPEQVKLPDQGELASGNDLSLPTLLEDPEFDVISYSHRSLKCSWAFESLPNL